MLPDRVRTAMELRDAIASAPVQLKPIGYCPSERRSFREQYAESEEEGVTISEFEGTKSKAVTFPVNENEVLIRSINKLTKMSYNHNDYALMNVKDFNIKVTRPNCEYEGPMDKLTGEIVKRWVEHGEMAGYGDVVAQETKINTEIRKAYEIKSPEFSCDNSVLEVLAQKWSQWFIPRKVRVKSYKINIYPPGGHFKTHRDTPEKDLVGTVIIGLFCDGRSQKNGLRLGEAEFSLDALEAVAFHPDLPHEVLPIEELRASLAFKVFYDDNDAKAVDSSHHTDAIDKVATLFKAMPAPFGIKLGHQYCLGARTSHGFDSIMLEAAKKHFGDRVHLIPVITKVDVRIDVSDYAYGPANKYPNYEVYPMTDAHIDYLLGDRKAIVEDDSLKWLQDLHEVPFYDVPANEEGASSNGVEWKRQVEKGAEYVGNESRPYSEDSIYFAYGLIILAEAQDGTKIAEHTET